MDSALCELRIPQKFRLRRAEIPNFQPTFSAEGRKFLLSNKGGGLVARDMPDRYQGGVSFLYF